MSVFYSYTSWEPGAVEFKRGTVSEIADYTSLCFFSFFMIYRVHTSYVWSLSHCARDGEFTTSYTFTPFTDMKWTRTTDSLAFDLYAAAPPRSTSMPLRPHVRPLRRCASTFDLYAAAPPRSTSMPLRPHVVVKYTRIVRTSH